MKNSNRQKGFLKAIVVIIVALVILSYFGLDIRKLFQAGGTQNFLASASKFLSWLIATGKDLLVRAISIIGSLWNEVLKFLQSVQH